MANYLVTGAAGFIGYHVCERLLAEGASVVGVDNFSSYYSPQLKRDRATRLTRHKLFDLRCVELANTEAVEALFMAQEFTAVVHLAAQAGVRYSIENPHSYVQSNLVAFVNVLEGCRHHGKPHLVYASSSSVYGSNRKIPFSINDPVDHPVSLYAATKRANELMATTYSTLYGMSNTGLRFFTVYGPWGRPDMAIYRFAEQLSHGKPIDVYNHGHMKRDFTYVDDIVNGVVRATEVSLGRAQPDQGQHRLYNLGNNRPVALGDLIRLLENALGVRAERRLLPMQPGDVPETYADIDVSADELDFVPKTSIEEGIDRFVAWYCAYHDHPAIGAAST